MIRKTRFAHTLSLAVLIFISAGSAQASPGSGTITFAPSTAVPVLSAPMLLMLGVLLVVAAFRVMRTGNGGLNRIAGVLVLVGGLAVGGYSIKTSVANGGSIDVSGADCNTGNTVAITVSASVNEPFNNMCPNDLLITDITVGCSAPVIAGTCMENDIVPAGGSCTTPYCDASGM